MLSGEAKDKYEFLQEVKRLAIYKDKKHKELKQTLRGSMGLDTTEVIR